MNIKELRNLTNMTQREFGEYLKIPQRTIENWESEQRTPPEYVIELIEYKIKKEIEIMKERELKISEFENMTIDKMWELPKIAKIDATDSEVEYLDRAEILQDGKMRGVANVYFAEKLELNEYEYLKLVDFAEKYKKADGLQDILYSDIAEVFKGILDKIVFIK